VRQARRVPTWRRRREEREWQTDRKTERQKDRKGEEREEIRNEQGALFLLLSVFSLQSALHLMSE